jgi:D-3-phosphoglycerate dehydrogenase / 2-oxoglutarate reductase
MSYCVLIPDDLNSESVELLNKQSFKVIAPGKMTRDETLRAIPDADALIIRSATKVDAELLQNAPKLKAIVRAGVGVDNIDLAAATEHGVVAMNTPDGNTISTAEYTFGLLLSLMRNIPAGHNSLSTRRWERKLFMGAELHGKTLGIVGFGRIGRAVADRAWAFGMNVIASDPFVDDDVAGMVELDELYARSDIISLHCVATEHTRGMICAETIAKMKPGVYVINAARGAVINDDDLAAAIKSGHVGGAALDVYDQEPPSAQNPLIGLDNVIHTPHLAASTVEAQIRVAMDAAQQIIDALTVNNFRNVVDSDALGAGHSDK